jgi:hypothetical protein
MAKGGAKMNGAEMNEILGRITESIKKLGAKDRLLILEHLISLCERGDLLIKYPEFGTEMKECRQRLTERAMEEAARDAA